MAHIDEIKTLLDQRNRIELRRVPRAAFPEDRKRGDRFRAFSYTTQEVADKFALFMNEYFGDTLVNEATLSNGRIAHLYKIDPVLFEQLEQARKDAREAILQSIRVGHDTSSVTT